MGYYQEKLSGNRLRRCYEIAPSRVKQYLTAEIQHVIQQVKPTDFVLELGCGYGRVVFELAKMARRVIGIDNALDGLALARAQADSQNRCGFLAMDATNLAFAPSQFNVVVCLQNGICAFRVDQARLVEEAVRVTRPGGRVLFSSYAEQFWSQRLEWFELQAQQGLVGEIDYGNTRKGTIVCKDGFQSGTMTANAFEILCYELGLRFALSEVDESSVFCEIQVPPSNSTPISQD